MKFWLIVTGYNCEKYVKLCSDSIQRQTYKDYEAVFVNDASTDNTLNILLSINKSKWCNVFSNESNKGAAYNRYHVIKQLPIQKEDVVLLLGMDDELLPNCLELIKQQYDSGAWMTYGNWMNQKGVACTVPLDFTDEEHEQRSYRSIRYRSTAPNTFKKFLFDELKADDFKFEDDWLLTCTETNMMLSFLEMCGKEHIGIIRQPIYLYRENLPRNSVGRYGRSYKDEVLKYVINLPKKQLWRK